MSTPIAKWLPRPGLSLLLLATWLLLHNSVAPGQWLLGGVLALLLPWLLERLWPETPRPRRLDLLPLYLGRLLWDIVISNLSVARLILNRSPATTLHPAFISLPLALRDERAIAILAATITLTPGTMAVELSIDRRELLMHCLDLDDAATLIATLRQRYEALLLEMFPPC